MTQPLISRDQLRQFPPHTRRKLTVHEKYLRACLKFEQIYQNFLYIDTHGGTGLIRIDDKELKGSAVQAATLVPSVPCFVIEIDPDKAQALKNVVSSMSLKNLSVIEGDCNVQVPKLLQSIPQGYRFVLCFLDPDGYVYERGSLKVPELTPATLQAIGLFPRTEILVTLPLEALRRTIGYVLRRPRDPKSETFAEGLTQFLGQGCVEWLKANRHRSLDQAVLDFFLLCHIQPYYQYKGALLVKNKARAPQYYLVFGSNHKVGAKIMRDIMKKEWLDQEDQELLKLPPWEYFIFDDRLIKPKLPGF